MRAEMECKDERRAEQLRLVGRRIKKDSSMVAQMTPMTCVALLKCRAGFGDRCHGARPIDARARSGLLVVIERSTDTPEPRGGDILGGDRSGCPFNRYAALSSGA
jgi:hypothetical protein